MPNLAGDNSLKYSLQAAIVLALAGMGDAFLYAYLPANYQTIGISIVWVGLILSINRFTRLFLNGWVAYRLSKHGIRIVTIATSIIAVVTTISYGFTNSIILWVIVRVLWGITFSTLRLGSIIYAMQHNKQGISLGLSRGIIELGSVFALLLGSILLTHFDRAFTFILLGAISAIGIFIALLLPQLNMPQVKKKELILSFPSSFNAIVLMNAFVVEGMMVVLLSRLIINDFGVTPQNILIITSFCLGYRRACLVFFSPIAGWLADKWGFEKLFNYTTILLIVGIGLVAFKLIVPGLIVAFTFAAMNASVAPGGAVTKTGSLLKDISDNATWRDIGTACGTLVGAFFLDFSYIHLVFMIAIVPLIAGVILHFLQLKRRTIYDGIS